MKITKFRLFNLFAILLILANKCTSEIYEPIPDFMPESSSVFQNTSIVLKDTTPIDFNLPETGTYELTLQDEFTGNIVSREKFNGVAGKNKLNVYTKVLPKGSYRLILINPSNIAIQETNIKL
jgi:hypothetical protein